MKVLVTGGAGFIGSHTVDALVDRGDDVAVLDDLSTGSRGNLNPKARFYELDMRSANVRDVFAEFQPAHVIHLAAQMDVRISLEQPVHDADLNVLGSLNLLQHCIEFKTSGFVFSSTGGAIYGEPDDLPASEDCPPAPLCHYGVSKFSTEQYIALYHRLYGLRFSILRYGNVYGPRQNPHGEAGVCAILTGLMLDGKTPVLYGYGEPLRDYVYVEDVVRANIAGLENPNGATLNIGTGAGTPVMRLFEIIRRETAFEGEPDLQPLRAGEVDRVYLSNTRAAETLGWHPQVALEDGLAKTVASMKRSRG